MNKEIEIEKELNVMLAVTNDSSATIKSEIFFLDRTQPMIWILRVFNLDA